MVLYDMQKEIAPQKKYEKKKFLSTKKREKDESSLYISIKAKAAGIFFI